MNRTIEDIQKDIELLGIKGGYDIEQLLTPQDCRRLSYEIERLNNIINEIEKERCRLRNSNELLENAIDTLRKRNEEIYEGFMATQEELKEYAEENEQLHSIIKEVREYIMSELITEWDIANCGHVSGSDLPVEAITPILDILDKEKDNE